MIDKALFDFLKDLKENNHRDWFHANKKTYDGVKKNVLEMLERILPELEKLDPDMTGLEPKKCIFRINRDIRFSKDKSPYKTNFGSFMVKGGKSSGNAGYYIHFEPGNSFIAGGIYMPPGPQLRKVRTEIYYNVDEFKAILEKAYKSNTFTEISGEKLKRPPKDFPAEFPDIELLKYKSYGFVHYIDDEICWKPDFEQYVMKVFADMSPAVRFINRGLAM